MLIDISSVKILQNRRGFVHHVIRWSLFIGTIILMLFLVNVTINKVPSPILPYPHMQLTPNLLSTASPRFMWSNAVLPDSIKWTVTEGDLDRFLAFEKNASVITIAFPYDSPISPFQLSLLITSIHKAGREIEIRQTIPKSHVPPSNQDEMLKLQSQWVQRTKEMSYVAQAYRVSFFTPIDGLDRFLGPMYANNKGMFSLGMLQIIRPIYKGNIGIILRQCMINGYVQHFDWQGCRIGDKSLLTKSNMVHFDDVV